MPDTFENLSIALFCEAVFFYMSLLYSAEQCFLWLTIWMGTAMLTTHTYLHIANVKSHTLQTLIEALKYATTGETPTKQLNTFVHDPKVCFSHWSELIENTIKGHLVIFSCYFILSISLHCLFISQLDALFHKARSSYGIHWHGITQSN